MNGGSPRCWEAADMKERHEGGFSGFLYTNAGGFLGEATRISSSTAFPGAGHAGASNTSGKKPKGSLAEARDHILDAARVIRGEFYVIERPAQCLGVRLVG